MSNIPMPDYCRPPSASSALKEMTTPFEWASSFIRLPTLLNAPRGDGRPVMLLPGYMTGELSMSPLQGFLRAIGYKARQWGLGVNVGDVDELVVACGPRVEALAAESGEPVTLIGWSLGGVVAREVARLYPNAVSEVITMGTPIIGGPKYTLVGSFFAKSQGLDLDDFEEEVHRRNSIGLKQPLTIIYSKTDGIVSWQSAIDPYNEQANNIEVKSTHFGLGLNPKIWRIVADTMAAS